MRASILLLLSTFSAVMYSAGCGSSPSEPASDGDSSEQALSLDRQVKLPAGLIDMGQLVYGGSANQIRTAQGEKHAYIFKGTAGDVSQVAAGASGTSSTVTVNGPASLSSIGPVVATSTSPTGQLAVVLASIAKSGVYVITVATTSVVPYQISMSCRSTTASSGCLPNAQSPMSFGSSRITQQAIDRGRYKISEIFTAGDFLFDHRFTTTEGWGNALTNIGPGGPNPRPNLRKVHNGKFGGPDSNNCVRCHLVGGSDGGGDLVSNLFQDGDGINQSSALVRNPPQLIGTGYLQQLGIEMTKELQQQLADAQAAAASTGTAQTVSLSSKGVSYGTIVVPATGTPIDFSGLQGIDSDLVVKPLGWKGRVATARRFVEGGFEVHLGMQTQALIAKNCKTSIPDVLGTGPDCADPNMDGVKDEITEGQLTAMAVYATVLQAPVRVDPTDQAALARVRNGEFVFNQVGCAGCHQTSMELNDPVHLEPPDLSGGAPLAVDLTVEGHLPRLAVNGDGVVLVELFSDLKRHSMGATLADPHSSFGTIAADQFMTPPLWGVAATAPYLHDGRASNLFAAIALHDGEGADSAGRFRALSSDDQQMLVEFLRTLARDPAHAQD